MRKCRGEFFFIVRERERLRVWAGSQAFQERERISSNQEVLPQLTSALHLVIPPDMTTTLSERSSMPDAHHRCLGYPLTILVASDAINVG